MTSVAVVARYLDALNRLDVEAMIALTDPDFEFRTPRAVLHGHGELRDAMAQPRSLTVTFVPERWFACDERVVCCGLTRFAWPETGEAAGEEASVARGVVHDGRLRVLQVYEEPNAALRDAGLTEADERPTADA
jgi:hypothetical protein